MTTQGSGDGITAVNNSKDDANIDVFKCWHGGPGELVQNEKNLFLLFMDAQLEKIRTEMVRLQPQEMVASELVVFEEVITKNDTLASMVDDRLMRYYFGLAATVLLEQGHTTKARQYTRIGIYVAMYLIHGSSFWKSITSSPDVQQKQLKDMYTSLGLIQVDEGLIGVLNQQTPCSCLEQAFPSLQDKRKVNV